MLTWCALARAPHHNTTLVYLPVQDRCIQDSYIDAVMTTDETVTEAADGLRSFQVCSLGVTRRPGGFCPTSVPLVRLEGSQNLRVGCVLDAYGGNTAVRSSYPRCYQHEWPSSDIDDYEASCELLTPVDRSDWVSFDVVNDTDGVAEPTVWTLSCGVVDSETGSELAKALCQVRYWISVKYAETKFYLQRLLSTSYREVEVVTSFAILAKVKSQKLSTQLASGLLIHAIEPVLANSSDSDEGVLVEEECENGSVTRRRVTQQQALAGITGSNDTSAEPKSAGRITVTIAGTQTNRTEVATQNSQDKPIKYRREKGGVVTNYRRPVFGPPISPEMRDARKKAREEEARRIQEEKRRQNLERLQRIEEETRQRLREERARIIAGSGNPVQENHGFDACALEIQGFKPPSGGSTTATPDQRPRIDRNRYNREENAELTRSEYEDKHRHRHEYTFSAPPQNSRNKPFVRQTPLLIAAPPTDTMDFDTHRDRNEDRDRERAPPSNRDTYRPNHFQNRRGVNTTVNGGTSLPRFHVQPEEAKSGDPWIFNFACTCARCRDEKNECARRGYEAKKKEEETYKQWKEYYLWKEEQIRQEALRQTMPMPPPPPTADQGYNYGYQNMGGDGYTGYDNNYGQGAYQQQWTPQQIPMMANQQPQAPKQSSRNKRRTANRAKKAEAKRKEELEKIVREAMAKQLEELKKKQSDPVVDLTNSNKSSLLYISLVIVMLWSMMLTMVQAVGNPVRGTCGIPGNSEMHAYNGNMFSPSSSSSSATEVEYFFAKGVKNASLPKLKDDTDPVTWIRCFKHTVSTHGLTKEQTALAFRMCMTTPTTQLYLSQPIISAEIVKDNAHMDVNAIYSAFLKAAGVGDYKRICKAEFNELKWDGSNIRLFELRFLTALADAGLGGASDGGKLELFLEKLPINLSTAIANVTSIDNTAKAVDWIVSYGHTLTPVNAVTTGPTVQEVAALQQEIEDLKAMMAQASINATAPTGRGNGGKKYNKGKGKQQSQEPTQVVVHIHGLQGQGGQQQQAQRGRGRGRGRGNGGAANQQNQGQQQQQTGCYSCGSPDHMYKDCKVWKQRIICNNCNKPGHLAKVCMGK